MSRIKLTDTTMDMILKMSEGNPGAGCALMDIIKDHNSIDPQACMGSVGAILSLDTFEIYGTDIYVIYKDKCNSDVRKMLMLMRSVQLGFLGRDKLKSMAADQQGQVNLTDNEWSELDKKVCDRLDDFKRAA